MKKYYLLAFLTLFATAVIVSCSKSDDEEYIPVTPEAVSPVVMDLTRVPYQKLSDYKFFDGAMKDQKPALGVLPFAPASTLFSDYALKKRFVWMPRGKKAVYNSDSTVLELPVGAALVKTFYYDQVQNVSPAGATRIIETRVMIRKADGWIFADYVWNAEQTEATLDLAGSSTDVTWNDANNVTKSTSYRIPSETQCIVCHQSASIVNGVEVITNLPIGIKPQNLNFNYSYGSETRNQLTKWIEAGYLENDFTLPTAENTTVDYNDSSKPLELRARSYVDINCAHCHQANGECDYTPMRFAFSETANNHTNFGVCVNANDMQDFPSSVSKIVNPGNATRSMLYYRMNTTNEAYRMPQHGRTLIHEEGVTLMRDWINSLHDCP